MATGAFPGRGSDDAGGQQVQTGCLLLWLPVASFFPLKLDFPMKICERHGIESVAGRLRLLLYCPQPSQPQLVFGACVHSNPHLAHWDGLITEFYDESLVVPVLTSHCHIP